MLKTLLRLGFVKGFEICRFATAGVKSRASMKTLYLLRHAKSSWDDPAQTDFERPLNKRGLKAAPFMGELMAKKRFEPSVIVSSPAMRAKTTARLVKDAGSFSADIIFEKSIYEASPNALRQVISEISDNHSSALLVGHNPGIEGFIRYLTGDLEPMPTAALAVIELEIEKWDEINDGNGELKAVYRPKELTS
ncbi:MAG: histidine phosphatase family protein [Pyrinomonadaceae bacterium]|nr:histidine phosphatase family protein [Chloracidobacterium sp.]